MAHSVLTRQIDRELSAKGLPTLDIYDVLLALEDAPERRLKMSELADRVLLSRSGITRLVDRLEADGLLERMACKADRRALYARLTDKGLELREKTWPAYQSVVSEVFAAKITEAEARTMSTALIRVLEDQPPCIFHGMPEGACTK